MKFIQRVNARVECELWVDHEPNGIFHFDDIPENACSKSWSKNNDFSFDFNNYCEFSWSWSAMV